MTKRLQRQGFRLQSYDLIIEIEGERKRERGVRGERGRERQRQTNR